jgi:UDP-glucose 4-epimerase
MNILLTGGCGYIGSHCALELIEAGYNVIIADNLVTSSLNILCAISTITDITPLFYQCDITDSDALSKIFEEHMVNAVIHFAGYKSVRESVSDPLKYYNNNVGGLLSLLKCMDTHNVRRIIFSSSATVYGMPDSLPVNENNKLSTLNPYGRTKLMCEQILEDLAVINKIEAISLRYFNPVGAHTSGLLGDSATAPNLFPRILDSIRNDTSIDIFGYDYATKDGTPARDYIHVCDLARGHVQALRYLLDTVVTIEYINLGTGVGYTVLDIISMFESVIGRKLAYTLEERRLGDAPEIYADCAKANDLLGWHAKHDLRDMVVHSCISLEKSF